MVKDRVLSIFVSPVGGVLNGVVIACASFPSLPHIRRSCENVTVLRRIS